MSFESTAILVSWVAIAALALGMAGMLRQIRQLTFLLRDRESSFGPPAGDPLLPPLSIPEVPIHRTSLLFFADSDCPSCHELLPKLDELASAHTSVQFFVLFRDASNGFMSDKVEIVQGQGETFDRLRVRITPFGVLASSEGIVLASSPLGSVAALERLLQSISMAGERDAHAR
jgi:thiol-disulfide isomerase/thioredoxin